MSILAGMEESRGDETRRAILRAARRLFGERGYAQTTLDEISEAAGFTKGAFYWHFDSKEDLLVEVFEDWVAEGVGNLRRALEASGTRTRVRTLDRWHRGDAARSAQWVRFELELLGLAAENPELAARLRERQAVVRDLLAAALGDELERRAGAGTLRPRELATLVSALSDGLLQQELVDPGARGLFGKGVELLLGAGRGRRGGAGAG